MNRLFVLFTLVCISVFSQNTVSYTELDQIIANPERGLQKYSITDQSYNLSTNYTNLNQTELQNNRTGSEKITLLFRYFLLNDFMNSPISNNYLNNIQKDFDIIRNAGVKCIVRFSYSDNITTSAQQPTKAIILNHINQLATILNANKDVIITHQAGFIGTYGEWYYTNSTEFGTEGNITSAQWQNRKEIVDAMLVATPSTIPIQVRYPKIKQTLYGNNPLSVSTAYQNTAISRIGFYNDAFLNDYGDQGTYSVSSQYENPVGTADYIYLSNETQFTPMSGETNGLNPPRTDGSNAVAELDATNFSFINRDYFEQNITNWINSGHFDTILKKLGYKLVLNNTVFSLNNNILNAQFNIQNKGFARIFKERKVYLVLKNNSTSTTYNFLLNTDVRTWENNNVSINENISLESLPDGNYSSYLFLPDNDANLINRPEYSIQLSNINLWESNTGFNLLNQTVTKTSLATNNPKQNAEILLFPNPVLDFINVLKNNNENAKSIIIYDYNGRIMLQKNLNENENKIDVRFLKSGLYLVKIIYKKSASKTYKIIKH